MKPGPQPWNAGCPATFDAALRLARTPRQRTPTGTNAEVKQLQAAVRRLEVKAAEFDATVANIRVWAKRVVAFIHRVRARLKDLPAPARKSPPLSARAGAGSNPKVSNNGRPQEDHRPAG